MKKDAINYSTFSSLEDAISFLDENALQLQRNNQITEFIIKTRGLFESVESKQKLHWEFEYDQFEFRGSVLMPFSHAFHENRNFLNYPNLEKLEQDAFAYLKSRASATPNPLLRAKYNHLLWKSPKGIKNAQYGHEAISAYLNVIEFYLAEFKEVGDENLFQIDAHFETLYALCNELKHDQAPIKALTQKLLKNSDLPFWVKASVLEEMTKYPKLFSRLDFKDSLEIYRQEVASANKNVDYFMLIHYQLPTAIKIAGKLGNDPKEWHSIIGECYLKLAEEENDKNRLWIKQNFHAKAIQAFLLAGNAQLKAKAEQLYFDLKPKVSLPTHEYEFELTEEQVKALEEEDTAEKRWVSDLLHNENFEKIYGFLTRGVFFPNLAAIKESAAKTRTPWMEMATTVAFDENKNIRKTGSGQGSYERDLYGKMLSSSTLRLTQRILHGGIKKGVLTYENFVQYLYEKTWLGRTFLETDLGGLPVEQNWIGQVAPSVVEYFVQTESSLHSKHYIPNFVLCFDSLVLKFEGLLRNFAAQLSVPTATTSPKGMREIYLHEILEHEVIQKHFNEGDLYFFKYLFTDKGLNLRNKVAHCFQRDDDYTESKIILLILALLRVGKYNFKHQR